MQIRSVRPTDHAQVVAVMDEWWGGRQVSPLLPRLFFEHFNDTSFAIERDGQVAGFLIGFLSQSRPGEAYIHFVGIHPGERGQGLGRWLYETFFGVVRARGATVVRAITSPVNRGSVAFHRQLGFEIEPGDREVDGIQVGAGHDGKGHDRVRFVKRLAEGAQPGRSPGTAAAGEL